MRNALVVVALLAASSSADALVLCTMPDGHTYAGDNPPAGCQVKAEYSSAPADPPTPQGALDDAEADRKVAAANAIEVQALAARRRIENDANRAADDLDDIRQKIANVPKMNAGLYQNNLAGTMGYDSDATTRAEALAALHTRERDLITQIRDDREQFAALTNDLAKAHGSLPPSWSRTMRCDRCP